MMIYDGTGKVEGGTGWYLVVLGQYRAIRVDMRGGNWLQSQLLSARVYGDYQMIKSIKSL